MEVFIGGNLNNTIDLDHYGSNIPLVFVRGNGGDDTLVGGSTDIAVGDAETRGVVAGNDLVVGGPGDDYLLGDNGRIEQPAPWWATGIGGASVTPFDEPLSAADEQPHPATAGSHSSRNCTSARMLSRQILNG